MCARDERVAATVAELGAVPHACAVVCDDFARVEVRLRAAGFVSLMSTKAGSAECWEEHVISRSLSPRLLRSVASFDVASDKP